MRRPSYRWWALLVLFGLAGCGGGAPAASGADPVGTYGVLPDLSGTSVMVFPVQNVVGGTSDAATRELEFALQEAGLQERWVLPTRLSEVVGRSPQVQVNLKDMPMGAFFQREVKRVGDPLFGQFRRLKGLTNASLAFVPLSMGYLDGEEGSGAWEVVATVLDSGSGRVVWFGTLSAPPSAQDDPGALAMWAASVTKRIAPSAVAGREGR